MVGSSRIVVYGGVVVLTIVGVVRGATVSRVAGLSEIFAPDELMNTLTGERVHPPRAVAASDGYLRFVESGLRNGFEVRPQKRISAEDVAQAFVEEHKALFTDSDMGSTFALKRLKQRGSRTYVRYAQQYGGLEVFGAEMVIKVNAAGTIEAVTSDVMHEMSGADLDALTPAVSKSEAAELAALSVTSSMDSVEVFEAQLMLYHPDVLGMEGPTTLVWAAQVVSREPLGTADMVLVDAHSGEVVVSYSLVFAARARERGLSEAKAACRRADGRVFRQPAGSCMSAGHRTVARIAAGAALERLAV